MQSKEEIFERTKAALQELFKIPGEKIKPESTLLEDFDLDSIDMFDLLTKIEDETSLELAPDDFKECRTIEHVVDRIHEMLSEGAKGTSSHEPSAAAK